MGMTSESSVLRPIFSVGDLQVSVAKFLSGPHIGGRPGGHQTTLEPHHTYPPLSGECEEPWPLDTAAPSSWGPPSLWPQAKEEAGPMSWLQNFKGCLKTNCFWPSSVMQASKLSPWNQKTYSLNTSSSTSEWPGTNTFVATGLRESWFPKLKYTKMPCSWLAGFRAVF